MKLILFRGRPGVGKTLLSELLSKQLDIPVLRKDDIYDNIAFLNADHGLRNKAAHDVLYAIFKSNVHSSSQFILDFAFQFDTDIEKLETWCVANNVELKSILTTCSDEALWAQRLKNRAENPTPNQLITDFEEFKKRYTTMQLEARTGELLIDTVNPAHENIDNIISFVVQFTIFILCVLIITP